MSFTSSYLYDIFKRVPRNVNEYAMSVSLYSIPKTKNSDKQTLSTANMTRKQEQKGKRTGASKVMLSIAFFITAIAVVMVCLHLNNAPKITPQQAQQLLFQQEGIKPAYYGTELLLAANKGDTAMIKLLITAGADPNTYYKGWTPLMYAAYNGHHDCVKVLSKAPGIDINKANDTGWTPLMMAAAGNHADCVAILLKTSKIDIHRRQSTGYTALDIARSGNATECVELLSKVLR